ncbi:hypothetical protein Tco_0052091 [Tanacetum coccineum]
MALVIVQILARSGFDEIEEFSLWMGVPTNHLRRESKYVLFVLRKYESFRRRPTAKTVGLRVADSHTGNHPKDDFTSLETIRRLCSVFGRRSHLGFEGETSEPKGRNEEEKREHQDPGGKTFCQAAHLLPGGTPPAKRQTLQPGDWVLAGEIVLLNLSFKALCSSCAWLWVFVLHHIFITTCSQVLEA